MSVSTDATGAVRDREAIRIVIVSTVALFIIFGIRLSFSVFFAEFVLVEAQTNAGAASIFSINMLVFALGSTPAGILLDRFGPRVVFSLGGGLVGIGLLLSGTVSSVAQLSLTYGVVVGIGLSVVGLGPIAANISAWVPTARRGRAIGVAFAGTGLGSLLFVPFTTWLISQIGWRGAFSTLGLICVFILAPTLLFGMKRAHRYRFSVNKSGQTDEPIAFTERFTVLFRLRMFWVMLFMVALNALAPLRALTVHQVAYMESVGITRETASIYVGLAGFITAGSYIAWGVISDRFGRVWAFTAGAFCLIFAVGFLLVLQSSQHTLLLIGYALMYALAEGTRSSQSTALASDKFQPYGLGLVNGLVGGMFGVGAAFAPWAVGQLLDVTGSYLPGFILVVVLVMISIIGFILVSQKTVKSD